MTQPDAQLWQPTQELIDKNLWPNAAASKHAEFYAQARQLLAQVNEKFVYATQYGWGVRDLDPNTRKTVRRLLFVDKHRMPIDPPGCTCPTYQDAKMTYPRSMDGQRIVTYCAHTLAYVGYRRLIGYMLTDKGYHHIVPRKLIDDVGLTFLQGFYQPKNPFQLYNVSVWLQRQLQLEVVSRRESACV